MSELDNLDDEIGEHIELETADNIARGMNRDEARFAALRKFGNISQIKEDTRAVWTWTWLDSLVQDIRYALWGFVKAPAFALTVVGTIGLALGLNTTLFTIFNAYVLKPFAVRDPYSLYRFNWSAKSEDYHPLQPAEFDDFRRSRNAFAEVMGSSILMTRANGYPIMGEQVSGNYFQMLGAGIAQGRALLPGDIDAAVISDTAWKGKFASAPDVIGSRIYMLGGAYEIVGIARPEFGGMSPMLADVWIPLIRSGPEAPQRVNVIGRLRDGASLRQAEAELLAWAKQETESRDEPKRATGVILESAATSIHATPQMLAMFSPILAAFGLVLVIACANVANMMLARAMARQREIGVRLSLGAGRVRLIRQLLTESLMLALPAALAGLVISVASLRLTERLMFATAPQAWLQLVHLFKMETDYRVFLFILMAAAVSTLLFGLAPAVQATRPGLYYATRGDFSADVRPARLRNALVIAQVAVCVLLLICSGVLLRSSNKIQQSDVRMSTAGVIDIRFRADQTDPKVAERLRREPGVELAAAVSRAPLFGQLWQLPIAARESTSSKLSGYNFVSPEYFGIYKIPILRGRNFTLDESRSEAAVTIVSEKTAAQFWPGGDAIGQTIRIAPDAKADAWMKLPGYRSAVVVGIARDVMSGGPYLGIDPTCFYFPTGAQGAKNQSLVLRVNKDSDAFRRKLEIAIAEVSTTSIALMIPAEQAVEVQVYPFKASSWIATFLGGLALVLTLSGIYGVLAYLVSQRTKEIGIRIAMGASAAGVVRLVLAQSMKLAMVGISIGVVFALGVSRLFASELELVNTFDLSAYTGGILTALLAAIAAGYFPSRRAAAVDPIAALRCD